MKLPNKRFNVNCREDVDFFFNAIIRVRQADMKWTVFYLHPETVP